jgi:drug/metabolite transporter (DMT)-like permease
MFQADNPTSPLFMGLLLAILLDIIFAWSGAVRGRLPNMRTSMRGARIAGLFAFMSLIFVFVSYYFYYQRTELFGTIAFIIAFALFVAGIRLAERIPD